MSVVRLHANEGRPPAVEWPAFDEDTLRRYPCAAPLEARLARRLGVTADRVLVTAGADDALERICRATLGAGRHAVVTAPTFEMIPRYARLAGAGIVPVPWLDRDFPGRELGRAADRRTGAVLVVTPCNPTGAVAGTEALVRLANEVAPTTLVVDLAYVEFADGDPTAALLPLPNVVITRTFSKAWGLAGLRVGYAIAAPAVIERMRQVGHPFPCSTISLALAAAALETEPVTPARVRIERDELTKLLRDLGAAVPESQANFVLARVREADRVAGVLGDRGFLVRRFDDPALADRLRVTCPADAGEFARLCDVLRSVL